MIPTRAYGKTSAPSEKRLRRPSVLTSFRTSERFALVRTSVVCETPPSFRRERTAQLAAKEEKAIGDGTRRLSRETLAKGTPPAVYEVVEAVVRYLHRSIVPNRGCFRKASDRDGVKRIEVSYRPDREVICGCNVPNVPDIPNVSIERHAVRPCGIMNP